MNNQEKLQAIPVQIITTHDGILLLRGPVEIHISGHQSKQVIEIMLDVCAGEGSTREQLLTHYAQCDHPAVNQLIDHLIKRRILLVNGASVSSECESTLDVFYWSFGMDASSVQKRLNASPIIIMGVNRISLAMAHQLSESQMTSWSIVDDPKLRNIQFFEKEKLKPDVWSANLAPIIPLADWHENIEDIPETSFIVGTSDFGVSPELEQWNRYCVNHNITFLPVVLDRLVGHVGPMVTPGETACYTCFRLRENANMENYSLMRLSEENAFERQIVNAMHPAMSAMVADVATMELTKFIGQLVPPKFRNLIEIRMIPAEMKPRWIFKLPWCPVCGPLQHNIAANVDRYTYFPDNPLTKSAFQDKNTNESMETINNKEEA